MLGFPWTPLSWSRGIQRKGHLAFNVPKSEMITVTPNACARLAGLLDDRVVQQHHVLRVVADRDNNLELSLEAPQLEDTVFSYQQRNVLAIEPAAAQLLSGTSLDL